jgi:hypothetical protein
VQEAQEEETLLTGLMVRLEAVILRLEDKRDKETCLLQIHHKVLTEELQINQQDPAAVAAELESEAEAQEGKTIFKS